MDLAISPIDVFQMIVKVNQLPLVRTEDTKTPKTAPNVFVLMAGVEIIATKLLHILEVLTHTWNIRDSVTFPSFLDERLKIVHSNHS